MMIFFICLCCVKSIWHLDPMRLKHPENPIACILDFCIRVESGRHSISGQCIQELFHVGMGTLVRTIKLFDEADIILEDLKAMENWTVENCSIHRISAGAFAIVAMLNVEGPFFKGPWSMLDEMRSVRSVQLKGRRPKVSEFVGKQIDIFDELGFEIPKGCRPTSRKKPKTRRSDLY